MSTLGLFPLPMVLLPGERTALHIFEPRYKDLIGRCLEDGRDFGIVFADAAGLRRVGTRASVVEVLERFDDGRLNIAVLGGRRFRFEEVLEELSYLTAEVEDHDDTAPVASDAEYEEVLAEYRKVVAAGSLELEEPVPDYEGLAFKIAVQMELAADARQQLLELREEPLRLTLVRQLLALASATMRRRMIERRASTNGHVTG